VIPVLTFSDKNTQNPKARFFAGQDWLPDRSNFQEVLRVPTPLFPSRLAPHTKVTEEQLATEEGLLAFGQNLQALNRRRFLTNVAAIGAIAAAGTLATSSQAVAQSSAPTIADVLNFALNFEYLEGEFYSQAYNAQSISQNVANKLFGQILTVVPTSATLNNPQVSTPPLAGTATTPATTQPGTTILTANQQAVILALAQDEVSHIAFLQQAIVNTLGGTPIAETTIDYSAGGTIPAITTQEALFVAARQFTALGNSAYAGAAADLVGNTDILLGAAQILGAEAQHLGVVNYICVQLGITPATDTMIDAQDVPPNGTANIFTVTAIPDPITATSAPAAVGISRTPQQVLGVAYGVSTPTTTTPAAGVVKGGFFPNGVSGNIVST
jgi:hypothetical protein